MRLSSAIVATSFFLFLIVISIIITGDLDSHRAWLKEQIKSESDFVAQKAAETMADKAAKYSTEGQGCFLLFRAKNVQKNRAFDDPRLVMLDGMEKIALTYRLGYESASSDPEKSLVNNRDYQTGIVLFALLYKYDDLYANVDKTKSTTELEALKKEWAQVKENVDFVLESPEKKTRKVAPPPKPTVLRHEEALVSN
jgi:hypothetical protein